MPYESHGNRPRHAGTFQITYSRASEAVGDFLGKPCCLDGLVPCTPKIFDSATTSMENPRDNLPGSPFTCFCAPPLSYKRLCEFGNHQERKHTTIIISVVPGSSRTSPASKSTFKAHFNGSISLLILHPV